MTEVLILICASCAILGFAAARTKRYLKYFQQETYSAPRFRAWLHAKKTYDKRGSILAIGIGILSLVGLLSSTPAFTFVVSFIGALLFLCIPIIEENPETTGKLKLIMTQRATKMYQVTLALVALFLALFVSLLIAFLRPYTLPIVWLLAIAVAQGIPYLLLAANELLAPFEKRVQDHFLAQAKRRLAAIDPLVIGITGSYGKTSTKAILGDLLNQCVGPTFWPRGSINTVMGITRDIRENMRPTHKFAITEMGAYGIGSIRALCDFTPPKAAIVTAVGVMHLERFGSPEAIYTAKSELPRALPADGILVCNGDNPGARKMAEEFRVETTLVYGLDPSLGGLDCWAENILYSERGTTFTIHWKGQTYPATTPLLGSPALSNILAAFTMTCALGGSPAYVAAALSNLQPVENRLSLERSSSAIYLKDAFNSNPTGFSAALQVLKSLKAERRILITPGMIELGNLQDVENEKVAVEAAPILNLAIIVGETNREALTRGLKSGGLSPEAIKTVSHRDAGFELLKSLQKEGDAILVENDLTDLYEGPVNF